MKEKVSIIISTLLTYTIITRLYYLFNNKCANILRNNMKHEEKKSKKN